MDKEVAMLSSWYPHRHLELSPWEILGVLRVCPTEEQGLGYLSPNLHLLWLEGYFWGP